MLFMTIILVLCESQDRVISLRTFRKGAKVHNAGNLSNDFSKKVSRGETLKPSARDFLIESLMLVKSLFETP